MQRTFMGVSYRNWGFAIVFVLIILVNFYIFSGKSASTKRSNKSQKTTGGSQNPSIYDYIWSSEEEEACEAVVEGESPEYMECKFFVEHYPCCLYSEAGHNCCKEPWWNEGIRFDPIPLNSSSRIVEIGGNIGGDATYLWQTYQPAEYTIFEPVPSFYDALKTKFGNIKNIKLENYGLASSTYSTKFSGAGGGSGQWTHSSQQDITVQIKDLNVVGKEFHWDKGLDLLHSNCEGCEFEVFEVIIKNGWHKKIRYINLGTHKLSTDLTTINERYCRIQEALSKTHNRIKWLPWAWEKWVLKTEVHAHQA